MKKKKLRTDNITNELENASLYFEKKPLPQEVAITLSTPELNKKINKKRAIKVTPLLNSPRDISSEPSREKKRELPTRDEIQEFSFRLRDELKVKVQAEVPYQWQDELEETARRLKVKKLELYRYILGQFLGKTK